MLGLPAPRNWLKSNELSLHQTQGASPLKGTEGAGAAGAIAGAFGGAKGGAALGTVIAPGPGTAIFGVAGALVGGIGASTASKFGWEEWVPPKVRDAIDEGLAVQFTGKYRLVRQVLADDPYAGAM